MTQKDKSKIDDFIDRSFRDVADADYLAARVCWRRELHRQFWWMALQAVEKYLKGILLFSRTPIHDLGHDLVGAFESFERLDSVAWKPEASITDFIKLLNAQGPNRYFEWNLQRKGDELLLLDECIWKLRIRCVAMASNAKVGNELIWTSEKHFEKIVKYRTTQNPSDIWIPFGLIEKILSSKSDLRKDLTWKNFYFGRNRKKRILWKKQYHFSSPTHAIHPHIFPELDKLVKFSKGTREYFRKMKVADGSNNANLAG
jgi:hypothetical protein